MISITATLFTITRTPHCLPWATGHDYGLDLNRFNTLSNHQQSIRLHTIMPGSPLQSDNESACRVSSEAWEQRLLEAEGLDQTRSIMDGWRAEESALEPDLDSLCFYESLVAAFHRGDVPLVKYFLEEGVQITYTLSRDALSDGVPENKRPEILETLYRHGWDLNQKSPWRFTILR